MQCDLSDDSLGLADKKGQEYQLLANAITKADEEKTAEEIVLLEARLGILYEEYSLMAEGLEIDSRPPVPAEPVYQEDSKPWYRKAILKVARKIVDRPEYNPGKVILFPLSSEEKKRIAAVALDIEKQIETLSGRRVELMTKLDYSTCETIEQKSDVVRIQDFVARKSRCLVELASRTNFEEYILDANLTEAQRMKLRDMVIGYGESVATAKEIDSGVETRPLYQVLDEIIKFSPEKLKAIAEFSRPTLLIVPKNDFKEKRTAMDGNRKYPDQKEMYVLSKSDSPYKIVTSHPKVRISIVDGAAKMPHIQGIAPDSRFDERKRLFKKHYADKKVGMRLIDVHEYAVLMQYSLRDFERTGSSDTSKIADFYRNINDTATCLDDEDFTSSPHVAHGCAVSDFRNVYFGASYSYRTDGYLRGRPSVPVMEY